MSTHEPATPGSNAKRTWSVVRQDDNGNSFIVREHLSHEEALRLVEEFEARGHKQVYMAAPEPEGR